MPIEEMHISEVTAGTPNAIPMREIMNALGGMEGHVSDPVDGSQRIFVSLNAWRKSDPDSTFFEVKWKWIEPGLVGTRNPNAGRPRRP